MPTTVRIEGLRALDRKLVKLGKALPKRVQGQILETAGAIVAEEARQLVPVDQGDLRDSIGIFAATDDGGVTVDVGPAGEAFHGIFVEFGTVKMGPRPFMTPAFDNTEGAVRAVVGDGIRAHVLKATRG